MDGIEIELSIRSYLINPLRAWSQFPYYTDMVTAVDGAYEDKSTNLQISIPDLDSANVQEQVFIEVVSGRPIEYETFSQKYTISKEYRVVIDLSTLGSKMKVLQLGNDITGFLGRHNNFDIIQPVELMSDGSLPNTSAFDAPVDGVSTYDYLFVSDITNVNERKFGYKLIECGTDIEWFLYRKEPISYWVHNPVTGEDIEVTQDVVNALGFVVDNASKLTVIVQKDGAFIYLEPKVIHLLTDKQRLQVLDATYVFIDQDDVGEEVRDQITILINDSDFNSSSLRKVSSVYNSGFNKPDQELSILSGTIPDGVNPLTADLSSFMEDRMSPVIITESANNYRAVICYSGGPLRDILDEDNGGISIRSDFQPFLTDTQVIRVVNGRRYYMYYSIVRSGGSDDLEYRLQE